MYYVFLFFVTHLSSLLIFGDKLELGQQLRCLRSTSMLLQIDGTAEKIDMTLKGSTFLERELVIQPHLCHPNIAAFPLVLRVQLEFPEQKFSFGTML